MEITKLSSECVIRFIIIYDKLPENNYEKYNTLFKKELKKELKKVFGRDYEKKYSVDYYIDYIPFKEHWRCRASLKLKGEKTC